MADPVTVTVDRVREKMRKIHNFGTSAFVDGTVKPFEGFDSSLGFRANVSWKVQVTPDVVGLCNEVLKRASAQGLETLTANIHYPLHCTMLEADVDPTLWASIVNDLFSELNTLLSLGDADLIQPGQVVSYDELVLNLSGDLLLMASEIPPGVIELRDRITAIYLKFGLKPRPMDDILHMTVQRIKKTDAATQEALLKYYNEVLGVHDGIHCVPFDVTVGEFYRGPALGLLESKP